MNTTNLHTRSAANGNIAYAKLARDLVLDDLGRVYGLYRGHTIGSNGYPALETDSEFRERIINVANAMVTDEDVHPIDTLDPNDADNQAVRAPKKAIKGGKIVLKIDGHEVGLVDSITVNNPSNPRSFIDPGTPGDHSSEAELEHCRRYFDKEYQAKYVEPRCECGADAVGGGFHSSWCPKHEEL